MCARAHVCNRHLYFVVLSSSVARKSRKSWDCIPSEADKAQWPNDLRGYKYTDCRAIPFYFPSPFFSSWPSRGYFARTITKKQGGPCGKTQYHPVMTAPYFSKVPLRGWKARPIGYPGVSRNAVFLSLSHSFPRHGTHINHRHFNIGWRTIPPPPRYFAKLCREFDQQPPPLPSLLETGFYGGILLICEYPRLWRTSIRRRYTRRLMRRRNYGNRPGEMCID